MTTPKTRYLVLLALAAACEPGIPQTPANPTVTAVFDPIAGNIPLPNDLALQPPPGTPLPAAQVEFLNLLNAQKGFPNDQELPVTISLVKTTVAQNGAQTNSAPTLDPSTVNAGTLVVFLKAAQGAGPVAIDPITDANYVNLGDHGVLTIHNRNRAPWTPGQYVVALRGGPNGVKTKEGDPIYASPTFFLIAQGQNLETEQNLTLLRAQTGSEAAARAAAKQLDQIIALYSQPNGAFAAVDNVFPHQEMAAMTTFPIAPFSATVANTVVEVDSTRGVVPLPIDLLRDSTGHISAQGACALAQGTYNAATGACTDSRGNPNSAAPGFQALDGFATTGAILAPTTDLVAAATITSATVKLFDISGASPQLVDPNTYITQPAEAVQSGLTSAIILQPAGATAGDTSSPFRTRPLKDSTDYAVVISDGVKDKTGQAIGQGTVMKILQFTNPISVGGKSQLIGIDDTTAGALERMRQKLPAIIAASGFGTSHVAMAYTFHTQTILSTATQLGALPYPKPATTGAPTAAIATLTPQLAFAKYGVDPASVANASINEVLETKITTFNLLDPATGAFNPAGITADETINVLIATPQSGNVAACAGALTGFGKCAPLVVFGHGIGRSRADMLLVANTFAAKGFVTVAIDAAKHGDRSFCTSNQATTTINGITVPQCVTGTTCTTALPAGAQGDTNPPGTCGNDPTKFVKQPVSPACRTPGACAGYTGADGIPLVSSNYLVSTNFFRTRDTLRQDIIDQSQLVRALAFVPSGPPPTGHALFDYMFAQGVIVDPAKVYFAGQSLGAIRGTVDVATNPRISRAVLNVGGGTIVDIFTTSPAFSTSTNALLAGLGIQPGANSAYFQFLVVAKTILDPADAVNFAGHLQANTLPNLLPPLGGNPNGSVPQAAKSILTQAAFCDQVVPNPWNYVLDSTAGTGPLPPTGAAGTFELFYKSATAPTPTDLAACPAPTSGQLPPVTAVAHGFLTDWTSNNTTSAGQTRAANFLSGTASPSSIVLVQ
jgi:dienelactone hydrolase